MCELHVAPGGHGVPQLRVTVADGARDRMNEHGEEFNPFKYHCSKRERCAMWDGFVLGILVTLLAIVVLVVLAHG
jgi:hypothetical protein